MNIASQIEKGQVVSLLERGRDAENKGMWSEAVSIYEIVPSVNNGGVANEYLEAQIRLAGISVTYLNQLTKAQSVLERLRMDFSDPAIDAYLGQIYFKRALYQEACERLDAAINSRKGSVIQQNASFRKTMLYYYASSLDRQYVYIDQNISVLRSAVRAWKNYMEYAACENNSKDKDCVFAKERVSELEKMEKKK